MTTRHCAFALLVQFLTAGILDAQFDPAKSPIALPPLERYNGSQLEPLAVIGDNSDFDSDTFPQNTMGGQSFYQDLDVAGSFLFAAAGRTFEIYSIAPIPSTPNRPRALIRAQAALPFWGNGDNGGSFYLTNIRAASESLVAIGMRGQGLSVWTISSTGTPRVAYQDKGVFAQQLHIVPHEGEQWAFVADAGSGGGLVRYNLSRATPLDGCLDDSPSVTPCPGVFQGEVGNHTGIRALAGAGSFVAIVPPGIQPTIEILDVSTPTAPIVRLDASLATAPESVTDIAIWIADDRLYLAALVAVTSTGISRLKLHDITCVTQGTCALPAAFGTIDVTDPSGGNQSTLSASTSQGRHFLYVGNQRRSGCRPQREFLLDVTNPSTPVDISPAVDADGYWGWFYMDCLTGFNNIRPVRGYASGGVFYRAAHSGLDAHRLVAAPPPPVSRFACSTDTPVVGELVRCTDLSTGAPDQWSWTFEAGTPNDSTLQHPVAAWSEAGDREITLVASNPSGPSTNTATATLTIRPLPSPEIFADGFESGSTAAWSLAVTGIEPLPKP